MMASKPNLHRLDTRRGAIEYSLAGTGPAVLALHGAMGGHDQGQLLARTIAEPGYTVVAPSRPGYLGTPLASGRSPEEQADLYATVLDACGIRDVAVMAVSGGGPSALHFAARHPDRCRCLVLVSTTGGRVDSKIPFTFKLMGLLARWPGFVAKARQKTESDLVAAARRTISDPELAARTVRDPEVGPLMKELLLHGFERMKDRLPGTMNDIAVTRGRGDYPLEKIAVPTLVVHGTRDPMVPFARHGKVLAERIAGAELLALDGGEHPAIFTHHALAQGRVTRFLREHPTVRTRSS